MRFLVAVCVLAVAVCLIADGAEAARRRRRRKATKAPANAYVARQPENIPTFTPYTFSREGIAATGENDKCGLELFRYTNNSLSFEPSVFVYCRDANNDLEPCADPITIDRAICAMYDAELADDENTPLNVVAGLPYIGDYDDGEAKAQAGRLTSSYPLTLGAWLKAEGTMDVICPHGKDAEMTMTFSNLVPNGVYVLNALYLLEDDITLVTVPFGGIPNVIVPDSKGRASIHRFLGKSCPFFPTPQGAKLQTVSLAYKSDLRVNPYSYLGPFDQRENEHIQVVFPVMARELSGYKAVGQPYLPDTAPTTQKPDPKVVFPLVSYP